MFQKQTDHFLGIPFLREGLYTFGEELAGIWFGKTHTDQALRFFLKNEHIRDGAYRAAFSKVVYQFVRHKRLLEAVTENADPRDQSGMDEIIDAWDVLFESGNRLEPLPDELPDFVSEDSSILYSWDPETWKRLEDHYKSEWIPMAAKLNEAPVMHLRTNTLKASREEVAQVLREAQISFLLDEEASSGIRITSPFDFFSSSIFKDGKAEMQDINSQLVAAFCAPRSGMKVLDTCAGAGGKTLHLAALMQNKGRILALDVAEKKLLELKKRAARANVQIIETRLIESSKTTKRLYGTADLVLIDAPCSGTGVVRRNPELKWRMEPNAMMSFIDRQSDLLDRYSKLAKPGGKVVFAVCSLFLEEGEKNSLAFISRHPGWIMNEEKRTSPLKNDADGFYFSSFTCPA